MNRLRILEALIVATFMLVLPAQAGTTQELDFTQQSGTTGGDLRRLIDISSPWSGGYIHEELTVIGRASITDSFTMNNLRPGSEVDYWKKSFDQFDIGFDINPAAAPNSPVPAAPAANPSSGEVNKSAAVVAGASVVTEPEADIRAGFRWLDLF